MCEICRQNPCCPACPNHTAKAVYQCDACGEYIYKGDTAYRVSVLGGDIWYCEDCCTLIEVESEDNAEF